jgi:Zn-dependent peptidase ImmA (M78 family)
MMAERQRIRFFSYEEVRRIAEDYSEKYKLGGLIPVDVERLVDNVLKINVIPFPSLYKSYDVNAFISNDFTKIYVDEHLYENYEHQYRFTLAHELGHMVLHGAFYKQFKIENLAAYVDFVSGISEDEYRLIETQANEFAGLFLIPALPLRTHFLTESQDIIHFLSSRFKGLSRDKYLGQAAELIAQRLSPIFNVHYLPIQIRMERDKLTDLIP